MKDETVEAIAAKYLKGNAVFSVGSSALGEKFLKKFAIAAEEKGLELKFVPTSMDLGAIAAQMNVEIVSMNDVEIDLAVEFVDLIDADFNYIKGDSTSLVRDKMIAQSAETLLAVCRKETIVERLHGMVPFEVATFGWKNSLAQLESLGKASLRKIGGKPYKTETGHYLVDVDVDEIYSYEDLDYEAKRIPGVLESGLFIGYADKMIIHTGKGLEVRSREGE